jgi:hypothetical protein
MVMSKEEDMKTPKKEAKASNEDFSLLRSDIKAHVADLRTDSLELGRLLLRAKDTQAWKLWGYSGYGKYLEGDLNMTVSEATHYIQIVRIVKDQGLSDDEANLFGPTRIRLLDGLNQSAAAIMLGDIRKGLPYKELRSVHKQLKEIQNVDSLTPLADRVQRRAPTLPKSVEFRDGQEFKQFREYLGFCKRIHEDVPDGTIINMALKTYIQQVKAASLKVL